jgi:hypothetical protein
MAVNLHKQGAKAMIMVPISFQQRGGKICGALFGFLHVAQGLGFLLAETATKPMFPAHNFLSQTAQSCVIAPRRSL